VTKDYDMLATAVAIGLLFFATTLANATNINYPGDPNWRVVTIGGATAAITRENFRSGNGSHALTTQGSLDDWAFYTRYFDSSFGLFSDINALSFDLNRGSDTMLPGNIVSWDPGLVQPPVLSLLTKDYILNISGDIAGNTENNFNIMPIDTWVSQSLEEQNFWRHTITIDGYMLDSGISVSPYTHDEMLMAASTSDWAFKKGVDSPSTADSVLYRLSIGVGSMWPANYYGYVDNVFLSFNGNVLAIYVNFELPAPVPEQATMLLLWPVIAFLAFIFSQICFILILLISNLLHNRRYPIPVRKKLSKKY
jgi:hypothetical protein